MNKYVINDNLDKIKILGRYAVLEGGSITCDNVGCGVAVNVDVDGEIRLNLSTYFGWIAGEIMLEQYLALFIDGERQERLMVKGEQDKKTDHSLTVCKQLKGKHTIEIIRSNEAMQCQIDMHSIELDGVLEAKPDNKDLYIEFFGDSITAGYGNLCDQTEVDLAYAGRYSDGTKTYAFLTARALDADFSSVCASGMAFSYGLGEHPVSWFYSNTGCFRNTDKYDFARNADLVVINLGTNDWDNCPRRGYELEDLREYVKPVIKLIRRHRPEVRIVWAYGMMNTGYADAIADGLKDLGGETNGLYFFRLPYDDLPRGGHWHPSVAGHTVAGQALTDYIKKIL